MAYPVLEISDWPGESDEDFGARNSALGLLGQW